ncbi:Uncharacterised protein [uncultured archaeon]|nr:Uncharacterised protein [uncultured archaeon]
MKNIYLTGIIAVLLLFSLVILVSSQNISDNSTGINNNSTEYPSSNYTNGYDKNSSELNESVSLIGIVPDTFKIGDVQLNIRVRNNEKESKTNLIAIVSGEGYSTYDIVPIDTLDFQARDYIIVTGNFKQPGNITLTIKIDNNVFYQNVTVLSQSKEDLEEQQRVEAEKQETLANLSSQLSDLKDKYSNLESDYYDKKDNNYDVSKVNLDQLKSYLRSIDSNLLNEDIKNAKANIKLANDEYNDQKAKVDSSTTKSILTRLKDNAIVFSAIAGAILTFFALSELLKRKGEHIVGRIKPRPLEEKPKKKK